MNYGEFLKIAQTPLTANELKSAMVTSAADDETQWWKGWSVLRAIRHKRAGLPTTEDLYLIEDETNIVVSARDYLRSAAKSRAIDAQNAEKFFPLESFEK